MLRKYFLFVLAASVFVAVVTWCMITKEKPKHLSWKKSALTEYIENIPSNVDMMNNVLKKDHREFQELWKNVNFTADAIVYLEKEVREHTKQLEHLAKLLVSKPGIIPFDAGSIADMSSKVEKILKQNEFNKNLAFVQNHARRLWTQPVKPYKGLKIVHLDLKGGAPRMNYLLQFMNEAKKYGGNALLLEYEDMFPWSNDLSVVARETAYSKKNILEILQTAAKLDMEVIPLVQTYGHLEFVLKHDQFKILRRKTNDNKSINAALPESVPFVKMMIDQVLNLHPEIKWFHIGGDEVFNLESCDGCQNLGMTVPQIYLHHMIPILKYVRTKRNSKGDPIIPIIWDDMFRRWEVDEISEITKYAVPMIWSYVDNLSNYGPFPSNMWLRYAQSFDSVFFASAFKGASKFDTNLMEVDLRAKNQYEWLKVVPLMERMDITVHGIAVTGWSRFSHEQPMCELLPVGTPSLALCLAVLLSGEYDDNIVKTVSQRLGVDRLIGQTEVLKKPTEYTSTEGSFLGSDVYNLVEQVAKLQALTKAVTSNPYQKNIINKILKYHRQYEQLKREVKEIFPKYFYTDTTNEWIETKIEKQLVELLKAVKLIEDKKQNQNSKSLKH